MRLLNIKVFPVVIPVVIVEARETCGRYSLNETLVPAFKLTAIGVFKIIPVS